MELNNDNKDNNDNNKNKSQKDEINSLINSPIKDLIELKNMIEPSLSNKEQQELFLKDLKQKIYHSLYENHSYKNNSQIIKEIINSLKQYLLSNSNSIQNSIIEALESLMMMLLFHFNIHINKIGFDLLKFLIDILEETYANQLLEYFLQIILLLNLKKQVNKFISSIIIYNISLGIYLIMSDTQIAKENKKSLFDFIKKNINDINLIYLLFIPYNEENSIKYSIIFNNDEIKFIYEKISDMLNKTYTFFNNNLPRKKNDKLYIQENINKIGILCKILDCVTIEGNKTYIIDKLIKNTKTLCEKILNDCLLELQNNNDLKFSTETIENIFSYFRKIGVFSFENILKSISFVNKKYNDYSTDYLSIIIYLVQELERLSLSCEKDKIKKIDSLIIQIIEIIIQKNKAKNNDKIVFDIYELYKINQMYKIMLKIDSKVEIPLKFSNAYKFLIEDKKNNINYLECIEKGFNNKNFNFMSQIYLDSIAESNKKNNIMNKNCFMNCLNKFEEFKNSIKESLCIKNGFSIDKSIEKEKKDLIDKENISYDDFKNFFVNNSMEMFKEIYTKE